MVKWKDSITLPQSIFYMVANKSNTRKEKKKSRKRNIFHSRHIWKRAETDVGRCRSKKKRMGGAKATEKLTSAYISYVRVILLSFWVTVCVYTRNVHCLLWCDPKGKHSSRKSEIWTRFLLLGGWWGGVWAIDVGLRCFSFFIHRRSSTRRPLWHARQLTWPPICLCEEHNTSDTFLLPPCSFSMC